MAKTYNVLIMGASYGSLLATKLLIPGHTVKLVCLPAEAELINREGAIVRLPVKGRSGLVEIEYKEAQGQTVRRGAGVDRSEGVRSRRTGHAGTAVSLAGCPGAARRRRKSSRAVHVHHEHASPALSRAHPRARRRSTQRRFTDAMFGTVSIPSS